MANLNLNENSYHSLFRWKIKIHTSSEWEMGEGTVWAWSAWKPSGFRYKWKTGVARQRHYPCGAGLHFFPGTPEALTRTSAWSVQGGRLVAELEWTTLGISTLPASTPFRTCRKAAPVPRWQTGLGSSETSALTFVYTFLMLTSLKSFAMLAIFWIWAISMI